MALTYTPATDQSMTLPTFTLPTVDGKKFSTVELKDQTPVCVMFIYNHCPYVKAVEDRLLALGREFSNVNWLAICSNDPADYPEDRPEELLKRWQEKKYPFPYLIDADQSVAKMFQAVCTPDIFLFDKNKKLFYRGRIDDSWRDPSKVTRQELREAIELAVRGEPSPPDQLPSMGCSIKWKA